MVEPVKRRKLADLLEDFVSCKVTDDEFVDASCEVCRSARPRKKAKKQCDVAG